MTNLLGCRRFLREIFVSEPIELVAPTLADGQKPILKVRLARSDGMLLENARCCADREYEIARMRRRRAQETDKANETFQRHHSMSENQNAGDGFESYYELHRTMSLRLIVP